MSPDPLAGVPSDPSSLPSCPSEGPAAPAWGRGTPALPSRVALVRERWGMGTCREEGEEKVISLGGRWETAEAGRGPGLRPHRSQHPTPHSVLPGMEGPLGSQPSCLLVSPFPRGPWAPPTAQLCWRLHHSPCSRWPPVAPRPQGWWGGCPHSAGSAPLSAEASSMRSPWLTGISINAQTYAPCREQQRPPWCGAMGSSGQWAGEKPCLPLSSTWSRSPSPQQALLSILSGQEKHAASPFQVQYHVQYCAPVSGQTEGQGGA